MTSQIPFLRAQNALQGKGDSHPQPPGQMRRGERSPDKTHTPGARAGVRPLWFKKRMDESLRKKRLQRRGATFAGKQQAVPAGDTEESQRNQERYDDRQRGAIRQHEIRIVLRHFACPGDERTHRLAAVVTGVMVAPVMEIKDARRGGVELVEAGGTDSDGQDPDTDQKAGQPREGTTGAHNRYGTNDGVHRPPT